MVENIKSNALYLFCMVARDRIRAIRAQWDEHLSVTPMGKKKKKKLSRFERKIYIFISEHFLMFQKVQPIKERCAMSTSFTC